MKSKGKKAEKNKTLASKKEEKSSLVESTNAIKTTEATTTIEVQAAVPIEVLPEVEAPAALVKEETKPAITSDERRRLISLAAYYRAERKGFGKTNPVEDWLLAEREVDAMITREASV